MRDGEPLLTNAVIVMRDPSNNVIGTRLTNGTEPYCLDNLPAGTYTDTETNPNGYLSTTPDSVTIADELTRGYSPVIADVLADGGIMMRLDDAATYRNAVLVIQETEILPAPVERTRCVLRGKEVLKTY